jgi:serine/threonine protein kinase/tetratricopeptide (TPR) repeat protein/TolB-like protein
VVGRTLNHYKILEPLGAGGMGEVYLAEDTRLERRVALKVLPADMEGDPERLERFEREAKAIASLNHPNIVTIHSVEEAQGLDGDTLHFITMELVEGRTLDEEIVPSGLTIDRLFAIAVPLADAVGAAHQRGITHRDLKPGNIMLTPDGRLKVLDFGLAKLAADAPAFPATDPAAATAATVAAAPITEEGKVLGTVAYMSPEQAEGKPVDNRSDIFSLGIILYELSTGDLPFTGDTKMSILSSIIKETPAPVTEIKRDLPNHLGRIINRCLEKDPDRRFQSSQDVRNDLAGLKEEMDSGEVVTTQKSIDAMRGKSDVMQGTSDVSDMAPAAGAASPGGWLQNKRVVGGISAVAVVAVSVLGWWTILGRDGDLSVDRSGSGRDADGRVETIADARPSVAILHFDNLSGDESLDWLRTGLTELLVTDLSQSTDLRVITTDALYEILEETGNLDARVTTASLVREVAERADVDHVVVASFIRAGETFRLSARLQEPATGETLAAETVEGIGEDSVFASLDDLTRRIKNRLEVPVAASRVVDRDLSEVATPSIDAYRHYAEGIEQKNQHRYPGAISAFERAVELDPEFAMAFAQLSVVYGNIFDFETAAEWAEKAIEHADRLTERERYYVEGRYYSLDPATAMQSIEAYEKALALYPDDTASRNNVALRYSELERYEEAVAHFEDLFRRGTAFLPAYFNAAMAYAANDECDKAYDLLRDLSRRQPEYHFVYQNLAMILVSCNRPDEAEAAQATYRESVEAGAPGSLLDGMVPVWLHILRDEFDLAVEANEVLAESVSPFFRYAFYPSHISLIHTYRGEMAEALAIAMEAAEAVPEGSPARYFVWYNLAMIHLSAGDPEAALEAIDAAGQTAPDVAAEAGLAALAVVAQARAGRAVAAETAARRHERLSEQLPSSRTERQRLRIEGELALARDDLATARQRLKAAAGLLPPGSEHPAFDAFVEYNYPLAVTELASGDTTEAGALFERITQAGSQRIYYPLEFIRSFYFLGKIAEDGGDVDAARRYYQRFLDYWDNGDIDTDRVEAARAYIDSTEAP